MTLEDLGALPRFLMRRHIDALNKLQSVHCNAYSRFYSAAYAVYLSERAFQAAECGAAAAAAGVSPGIT